MDSPCPNSPIPALSLSLYPSLYLLPQYLLMESSIVLLIKGAPGTPAQSEGLHYPGRELSDEITYFFFSCFLNRYFSFFLFSTRFIKIFLLLSTASFKDSKIEFL